MLSNNQKQPKCLKCGKAIKVAKCPNCGFNVMRESLLSIDKAGQDKVFYQNEFAYFKENNFDYCYQTGLKYSKNKVFFGSYYQNDRFKKEPIEWKILEKRGNKALLISKYALDCKKYNELYTKITWEKCTLRSWLNNEFLNQAFTLEERSKIVETTVKADANPKYSTNPGNDTLDKVFLLSISEVNRYFSSEIDYLSATWDRICVGTKHCIFQGKCQSYSGYSVRWWLRSPGYFSDYAANVDYDGSIHYYGQSVINFGNGAVRPALWVNLES